MALLSVAVAAALFFAWRWWDRASGAAAVERELLRVCFGDAAQAERLIDGEQQRAGGAITRAEAARRAVARHRRDNR